MSQLSFEELFDIEIEGWCLAIQKNLHELDSKMILQVIGEMYSVFHAAIKNNYVFNVLDVCKQFETASKKNVDQKTVAFYVLSLLPHPKHLDPEQKKTMASLIDQVEKKYGGAHERVKKRWKKYGADPD